jgi:hypothetical protein
MDPEEADTHAIERRHLVNALHRTDDDGRVDRVREPGQAWWDGEQQCDNGAPIDAACVAVYAVRVVHRRDGDPAAVHQPILRNC